MFVSQQLVEFRVPSPDFYVLIISTVIAQMSLHRDTLFFQLADRKVEMHKQGI